MSKIIAVINVMISNSNKISQVSLLGKECFFLYDHKHKWSISRSDDDVYYLHYYPGNETIDQLASMEEIEWVNYNKLITYSSKEIKTREAYESMQELYRLIKEKSFGIDEAFDDIINSDVSF